MHTSAHSCILSPTLIYFKHIAYNLPYIAFLLELHPFFILLHLSFVFVSLFFFLSFSHLLSFFLFSLLFIFLSSLFQIVPTPLTSPLISSFPFRLILPCLSRSIEGQILEGHRVRVSNIVTISGLCHFLLRAPGTAKFAGVYWDTLNLHWLTAE